MIFAQSISISILFFAIISFLPHLHSKNSKPTLFSFGCNIIGYLFATVFIYSCYITYLNTVLILTVPSIILFIVTLKSELKFRLIITKIELYYFLTLLSFFVIIFIIQFGLLYEFSDEYIKLPHPDYLFYSKVATNLTKYNIESFHMSPLAQNVPYHYFELWLNAFFNQLGLKSYSSSGTSRLLTHVIFHPVQKSLNRLIQVDYTVRIQSLTGLSEVA